MVMHTYDPSAGAKGSRAPGQPELQSDVHWSRQGAALEKCLASVAGAAKGQNEENLGGT